MGFAKRGVLGPAILQVHRKDGPTCLLMPWDTVFSEEQQGQGSLAGGKRAKQQRRARGGGRRNRSAEGVWWPHVPSVAQCVVIAG